MKATRLAAAAALTTTAALGVGLTTSAGATTPNGGALNMVNEHRSSSMVTAWAASDANGFQGMWCAVDVTNGWTATPELR